MAQSRASLVGDAPDLSAVEAQPMPPQYLPEDVRYCELCGLYLNGDEQFQNHLLGKKHAKMLRRRARRDEGREARSTRASS